MNERSVLVQPVSAARLVAAERRASDRYATDLEALTRPLETQDSLWWGARVRDVSTGGIGLSLLYPFRPGTYLAIDLKGQQGGQRTLLTRVVHVKDQPEGGWYVGCEFVKELTASDLELIV